MKARFERIPDSHTMLDYFGKEVIKTIKAVAIYKGDLFVPVRSLWFMCRSPLV